MIWVNSKKISRCGGKHWKREGWGYQDPKRNIIWAWMEHLREVRRRWATNSKQFWKKSQYLGSVIQNEGGVGVEVSRRVQSGWKKVSGVFSDRRTTTQSQRKDSQDGNTSATCYTSRKPCHWPSNTRNQKWQKWICADSQDKITVIRNEETSDVKKVENLRTRCARGRLRWLGHVETKRTQNLGRRVNRIGAPRNEGAGDRNEGGWTVGPTICENVGAAGENVHMYVTGRAGRRRCLPVTPHGGGNSRYKRRVSYWYVNRYTVDVFILLKWKQIVLYT